jgi:MoaA/NifB/PqqE/SkfB family radical SAM enzyme
VTEGRTEALPVRYTGLEDTVNRVPVTVVWEITLACDLACQHCGSRAGRRRRDELNTSEALDLVEQIAELGARDVGLIGGEAYLRKDWLQIIAAVRA